jgi:peptide chain release factor 1
LVSREPLLSLCKVDKVLAGEALDELVEALIADDRAARVTETG